MASVLAEMVDERLIDHPAILQNQEWSRLARFASDALHDLYQKIGEEHLT